MTPESIHHYAARHLDIWKQYKIEQTGTITPESEKIEQHPATKSVHNGDASNASQQLKVYKIEWLDIMIPKSVQYRTAWHHET